MYKFEHKCYKNEQNNKILSMTVNDVPFTIGFSESTNIGLRDPLCENILDAIHRYFKDYPFYLRDWVNLHTEIGFAVNELCSLQ